MLAHWMKPRYNQSAILLPAFGRSIRVLHNAYSQPRAGAIMHEHWMNIRGLLTQSTTVSVQKFEDRGYDDDTEKSRSLSGYWSFLTINYVCGILRPPCQVDSPGRTTKTGTPTCQQFRPPIALRTDLSHITTELWEIQV